MSNAFDVANFFIDTAIHNEEDCMTNLRLNKLLYFAQAWSLVKLGRPLFTENIEAWDYGPVVSEIYHKYKAFNSDPIKKVDTDYEIETFANEEKDVLLDVMREYGQYTTPRLVDITHRIDTPWYNAYYGATNEITKESILAYFVSKPLKSFDENFDVEKNLVGYLDENGIPVLPSEIDDDWMS